MNADVSTPTQAEALAARILTPREHPLLLVSSTTDGEFLFDIDALRDELDGIAEVVTIETGPATKHLELLLPPKAQVFNGAARSYPVDFHADPDWHRSHLRFPNHADTGDLVDDAMAQTGRRTVQSAPAPRIRRAAGIVQGFFAHDTCAMVRLDDGTVVTATSALLPPDIPLAAALIPGERVSGILEGRELQPEPLDADLAAFVDGAHTLALVVKVTDLRATVQLHPRVSVILRRRDVDLAEGPVSDVLQVGDMIRVRVHRAPGHEVALSLADADPSAPLVPSLALVAGGAPWLGEGRPTEPKHEKTPTDAAEQPAAPAASTPVPTGDLATRADVSALAHEVAALRGDLLAVTNLVGRGGATASDGAELKRLRAENEQLRAKLADERAERAKVEASLSEASHDRREAGRALRDARRAAERAHVDPPAARIRFEIERTWGNRTAPGARARWPPREFTFGAAVLGPPPRGRAR
ncbi:hypothetical protein, partial [Microbacterium sp. AR7-10]|uniref:hypothetical protein n=1 Tax=Microbacterium sp. AR7-10 TaxID=1891970 RepID=UPI0008FCD240